MKPITKYAKSGDINIAYQVVGQGPVDLIYVPGWISNIDMMWVDDRISKFLILFFFPTNRTRRLTFFGSTLIIYLTYGGRDVI